MKYFKLASIFLIIELMIVFIVSLLNLIGLNGGISSIILLILNIILFFILTFYSGKNSNEKGYLVGLLTSSLLIFLMFVINSIFYGINLRLSTIIYYLILILTGVIGGTIGINKKKEDNLKCTL